MNQVDTVDKIEFELRRFEVKYWWNQVMDYWEPVIELIPHALTIEDDADIEKTLDSLRLVYGAIQHVPCPEEADIVYTHVTRTVMLLIEVFDMISQFEYAVAEEILHEVKDASRGVHQSLANVGLIMYSNSENFNGPQSAISKYNQVGR